MFEHVSAASIHPKPRPGSRALIKDVLLAFFLSKVKSCWIIHRRFEGGTRESSDNQFGVRMKSKFGSASISLPYKHLHNDNGINFINDEANPLLAFHVRDSISIFDIFPRQIELLMHK